MSSNSITPPILFSNITELKKTLMLESLTVKELRIISKEYNIPSKSLRKKCDIISFIYKHFSLINNRELPVVSKKFDILLDQLNRIDIASWFPGRYHNRKLQRFLSSKDFIRMRNKIMERESLTLVDVINDNGVHVFVHLNLALVAAAYLNDDLYYNIYTYYLHQRIDEAKRPLLDQIQKLDSEVLALKFGLKMNKVNWELFDLSHALYVIKIGTIYKIGAVGIHLKAVDTDKLDNRLSSHRNTYAKFELITVISFTNNATVRLFESVIKISLAPYSIGKDTDTRLEQYSFEETDINVAVLIFKHFDLMNIRSQNLGSICPKEKIKSYNQKVLHNLS